MKHDFYILGQFVNSEQERESEEDITPQIFKKFVSRIKDGDELIIHINSVGGDVFSGISIGSMILDLNKRNIKTTCVGEGMIASIATVPMCACQNIRLNESSFILIHNCWSIVQGDSNQLRSEADMMDKINQSILSFYHLKFNLPDETLKRLMDEETWIQAKEISNYGLKAEIIPSDSSFKIAAKFISRFRNLPKGLTMEETNPIEEVEHKEDQTEETNEEVTYETQEEKPVEETPEVVTKDEINNRISGLQSTYDKQISNIRKDYENKISDFMTQLKAKEEELSDVKNKNINLTSELESVKSELSETTSALLTTRHSLEVLNSKVLTPNDELPTLNDGLAKCRTPKERVDFIMSGKYSR